MVRLTVAAAVCAVALSCSGSAFAADLRTPTKVAVSPSGGLHGNGQVIVWGNAHNSRFRIYESPYHLDRASNYRIGWFGGVGGALAIETVADDIYGAIFRPGANTGVWATELAGAAAGAFVILAVLVKAQSVEEVKRVEWITVVNESLDFDDRMLPLKPCVPMRFKTNGPRIDPRINGVKCPTLRRFASDLPPDLYLDGGFPWTGS